MYSWSEKVRFTLLPFSMRNRSFISLIDLMSLAAFVIACHSFGFGSSFSSLLVAFKLLTDKVGQC